MVTDTQAINNANAGLYVTDAAGSSLSLSVTQSVLGNNGAGIIALFTGEAPGVLNHQFAISDTLAVNNSTVGMSFTANAGQKLVLAVDTGRITGNTGDGLMTSLSSASQLFLARSVIAGNAGFGLNNVGGSSFTFSDNRIDQNVGGDVKNALTAIPGK